MNLRSHFASRSNRLLVFSVLVGLLAFLGISARVFGVSAGMGFDEMRAAIQAAPDYGAILFVNVLIGISVMLLILELRWDALRVVVTVALALVFGYLMTAFFNLDAADRFEVGEFRVNVVSDVGPLVDIYYGDRPSDEFTEPDDDDPLTEVAYRFAGRGRHRDDHGVRRRRRVAARPAVDAVGAGRRNCGRKPDASDEQREEYRRQLESPGDAILENLELPPMACIPSSSSRSRTPRLWRASSTSG